jgi:hypothetical protein
VFLPFWCFVTLSGSLPDEAAPEARAASVGSGASRRETARPGAHSRNLPGMEGAAWLPPAAT